MNSLPEIWGPALRVVYSPTYGHFSIHAVATGGFDALPMDYTMAHRTGLFALHGDTIEDVVEGARLW